MRACRMLFYFHTLMNGWSQNSVFYDTLIPQHIIAIQEQCSAISFCNNKLILPRHLIKPD